MELVGTRVVLKPLTRELCHEMFSKYVADPMMTDKQYVYSKDKVNKYYDDRTNDSTRKMFSVIEADKVIGEIQIKYINQVVKKGNLGIILTNDSVKGKGYGTEAEKLMINYAFKELGLNVIYADAVIRNKRSQHILDKLGFEFVYEDETFKYYQLKKGDNYGL